jgi:SH3-like domain-containing protein
VVGADSAAVLDGSRVMARVRRGTRLAVLEQRGQWLRVTPPGSDKSGWIALGEVRAEE